MSENTTKYFSLGGYLNWRVTSNGNRWLQQNIKEFKLSHEEKSLNPLEFEVAQICKIVVDAQAIYVSDNVLCTENELIFQEASTQKKMSIKALDKGFEILVEEKFPFFRYAAILDGFIKILAFRKGIVSLHASAIIINNRSFVFGSWRRIGKSTIIVQLLMSKGTAQIIADDAVFLTNEGKIIPYLRGIDLYPYLPVPIDYLSNKERLQVLIAKNLKRIPGLPKQLVTKGIKKLFLPRINFGEFLNTPLKYPITPDVFYKLNRNTDNFSSINKVSSTSISSFYGRSSYYEMSEYQSMLEMLCSYFPESRFGHLIIQYEEYQNKVNQVVPQSSDVFELSLSNDYSDIQELCKQIV